MAKFSDVNNVCDGSDAIYRLKEVLKAAGWSVPRSSDGLTYNASGDQISHSGSGAGGMANSSAWFVIQDPGDSHSWCFQRGTTNLIWRVKISPLDRFISGIPGTTQTPSATDERIIHGGGSDASPTFTTLFLADDAFRFHAIAQSTPVGTTVPVYGFWAFSTQNGTGLYSTMICQDPLDPDTVPELVGTRLNPTSGDADPVVYICGYEADIAEVAGSAPGSFGNSSNSGNAFYRYNYSDESFAYDILIPGISTYQSYCYGPATATQGAGTNPYNGADTLLPIIWVRSYSVVTTNIGIKGISKYMKMKSVYRQYPSTVDLATDAMVYLGDIILPWEDNTAPIT